MEQTEPITVTQVEAARLAGVSVPTLWRWEKKKLIAGKRIGGVRLYAVADIKALVLVKPESTAETIAAIGKIIIGGQDNG